MIEYVRSILGVYEPLSGDGVASINWEYLVSGIILIITIHYMLKLVLYLFNKVGQ